VEEFCTTYYRVVAIGALYATGQDNLHPRLIPGEYDGESTVVEYSGADVHKLNVQYFGVSIWQSATEICVAPRVQAVDCGSPLLEARVCDAQYQHFPTSLGGCCHCQNHSMYSSSSRVHMLALDILSFEVRHTPTTTTILISNMYV
jgi:hypothetical protein